MKHILLLIQDCSCYLLASCLLRIQQPASIAHHSPDRLRLPQHHISHVLVYGTAVLSHMLLIGGRAPNKVLFSRATGRAWQTDLFPVYDSNGLLERNEPVPFRLTRNLQSFFTPFGVDGIFVTVMACAAQVCGGLGRVLVVVDCVCAHTYACDSACTEQKVHRSLPTLTA